MALGLRQCATDLSRWNMTVFGQVPKEIQKKRKALNDMVLRDHDESRADKSMCFEKGLMIC